MGPEYSGGPRPEKPRWRDLAGFFVDIGDSPVHMSGCST